ncbi:hypothetical protein KP509_1Z063900 [Ceratopteris richardii]|nr:hypothetical protein KP509_1Z063900 [Ceratopteris richardii]
MRARISWLSWDFSLRSIRGFSSALASNISVVSACEQPHGAEELCISGIPRDKRELTSLLRSQSKFRALVDGKLTHTYIVAYGFDHDTVISNCIIQMYGICGCVKDARAVFESLGEVNVYSCNIMINVYAINGPLNDAKDLFRRMQLRDIITWNSMIAACTRHGHYDDALGLFWSMKFHAVAYDVITFVSILDACAGNSNIEEARKIHSFAVCVGFESIPIVGNSVISFYGSYELLDDAQVVFSGIQHRDIVSWTAMLSAFIKVKNGDKALYMFHLMQSKGLKPDKVSLICALDASAIVAANEFGQIIHSLLVEDFLEADIVASTALINMYGECNMVEDARNIFGKMLFHNVVSWTAMIAAFSRNKHNKEALHLFNEMEVEGVCSNSVTYVFALDACAGLLLLPQAQDIHMFIVARGFESDAAISVCLVNLYGKCGLMDDARSTFQTMPVKNVVAWSTMITSCTCNGCAREALNLFHQMQAEGTKPNNVTFVCLVDACTSLETLQEGHIVDNYSCRCGFEKDVTLCNALMNMYRKCGDLQNVRMVFDRMVHRNLVTWTALIAAYAQLGFGEDAVVHFRKMLSEGIDPDSISFTCVLSACSHSGLVDHGWFFFLFMFKIFNIHQSIDHFVCMIDLLGRVGHLNEAEALLREVPFQNLALPWLSLLGACQSCGDVVRGIRAALSYYELDSQSPTPCTMLGNVFMRENNVTEGVTLDLLVGDWVILHAVGFN